MLQYLYQITRRMPLSVRGFAELCWLPTPPSVYSCLCMTVTCDQLYHSSSNCLPSEQMADSLLRRPLPFCSIHLLLWLFCSLPFPEKIRKSNLPCSWVTNRRVGYLTHTSDHNLGLKCSHHAKNLFESLLEGSLIKLIGLLLMLFALLVSRFL